MQRPDRDEYINILRQNIGSYANQFNTVANSATLGLEYDTGSVMHYAGKVRSWK